MNSRPAISPGLSDLDNPVLTTEDVQIGIVGKGKLADGTYADVQVETKQPTVLVLPFPVVNCPDVWLVVRDDKGKILALEKTNTSRTLTLGTHKGLCRDTVRLFFPTHKNVSISVYQEERQVFGIDTQWDIDEDDLLEAIDRGDRSWLIGETALFNLDRDRAAVMGSERSNEFDPFGRYGDELAKITAMLAVGIGAYILMPILPSAIASVRELVKR